MSVRSYAAKEKVNSAVALYFFLIPCAFGFRIFGVSVEDVYIFTGYVDMAEKVCLHECVVALFMVAGYSTVLVHVESNHILEADFTLFAQLDQIAVHS